MKLQIKILFPVTLFIFSFFNLHIYSSSYEEISKEIEKYTKNLSEDDKQKINKVANDIIGLIGEDKIKKITKNIDKDIPTKINREHISKGVSKYKKHDKDGKITSLLKTIIPNTDKKEKKSIENKKIKSHENVKYSNLKTTYVILDHFFNNEKVAVKNKNSNNLSVQEKNYIWNDSGSLGYSKFGNIFSKHRANISHLTEKPTYKKLKNYQIYIITDPDSHTDRFLSGNTQNNSIKKKDIKNIQKWVKKGGKLILFADDWKPNGNEECDIENLNLLTKKFGIQFNLNSFGNKTQNIPVRSSHPLFSKVKNIKIKSGCSLTTWGQASPILKNKNHIVMAESTYGKGHIFAMGEPFAYNSNINKSDNYTFINNLVKYLIQKIN